MLWPAPARCAPAAPATACPQCRPPTALFSPAPCTGPGHGLGRRQLSGCDRRAWGAGRCCTCDESGLGGTPSLIDGAVGRESLAWVMMREFWGILSLLNHLMRQMPSSEAFLVSNWATLPLIPQEGSLESEGRRHPGCGAWAGALVATALLSDCVFDFAKLKDKTAVGFPSCSARSRPRGRPSCPRTPYCGLHLQFCSRECSQVFLQQ